jgi:hypothetical protein
MLEPGMVDMSIISATQETEEGGCEFKASPGSKQNSTSETEQKQKGRDCGNVAQETER